MTAVAITSLPIFSSCDRRTLARLIPETEVREVEAGEILYRAGAPTGHVYFLDRGKVRLESARGETDLVTEGAFGEEAALDASRYLSTATAEAPSRVLVVPVHAIKALFERSPMTRAILTQSLLSHSHDKNAFAPVKGGAKSEDAPASGAWTALGWLLAIAAPALVYYLAGSTGQLSWNAVNFLTVFTAAVVMWIFALVPEYIPALFIVMTSIVLGVVPNEVILSGYSSGSFFMALSVFGIGAVLVQSGFIYRFCLWLLLITPRSGFWNRSVLFFVGLFLTPVLPAANGRAGLLSPLVDEMVHILGYKKQGTAATAMAAAAFVGISLFSAAFITAKSVNFAVFGLFPTQVKDQFTWGYWAYASGVAILVMLALYLIGSAIYFRTKEAATMSRENIALQLDVLGKLTAQEWAALFGVSVFIIGVTTSSAHKIASPWIGLAILYILITLGSISRKGLRRDIDWPFLLMLGGFVGMSESMAYLGIDEWFAQHLVWIGALMKENFYLFTVTLAAAIYVVRFAVPNSAAIVLLASIFMPVAEHNGINPWVIGFMVIMFSDGWFAPYQCSYYLQFEADNERNKVFARRPMLVFNAWTNLFRLLAVFASIPFWQYLGLM